MRPTIERIPNLNELMDSVPDEIVRQIQQASIADEESKSEGTTMTNEKSISKSKRIRDYIDSHPNAVSKDIVAALSQFGITQSDVGNVRTKLRGSKPAKRKSVKKSTPAAPKADKPKSTTTTNSTPSSISVKALELGTLFLKEAGSLSNAKELLNVIDQVRSA